jgi:AmmeMemoRadiSam system protein A/AmmeMemoRadiSam system protein B
MNHDAIVFGGLMPHAPILVPGVSWEHMSQVKRTVTAMRSVARGVVAARPDAMVVISPHSPRRAEAFGVWRTPRLRGTFEKFGSAETRVDLPLDQTLADNLENAAKQRGLRTWRITRGALDHGAMVPLWYLAAVGWKGPTVIVSLKESDANGLEEFGRAIANAASEAHRRVAVIASGDMSHRLTPDAPCGYHEEGSRFDRAFVELLRSGAPDAMQRLDATLVETAAEDAVDCTRIALAAGDFSVQGREVLSYEGPFGVGYGVAILFASDAAGPTADTATETVLTRLDQLPQVARRAVTELLRDGPKKIPFVAAGELAERWGAFVTLRMDDGTLRGCRGSPTPTRPDLVEEVWHCARAAGRDPRFSPLLSDELPRVRFTVSVLSPMETVASLDELDPARYGVMVEAADGRGALLLPGIEGIETGAEQLRCVKHKAAIGYDEPVEIQRFTTRVFDESQSDS